MPKQVEMNQLLIERAAMKCRMQILYTYGVTSLMTGIHVLEGVQDTDTEAGIIDGEVPRRQ